MRRTICSLMLLGVIAGCGEDSGSSGGDKQAPLVAVTAPASIEGGETVTLSVNVTDNVDSGLTPTITCTGGTLTGTLLVTAPVAANSSIRCTATATDKAGNTGTGSATIEVRTTTASLTVAGEATTLTQGKLAVLFAENLPLTAATYNGTIGGKAVVLARTEDGKSLAFATPEGVPAGAQTLNVTIGTRTYNFTFQVAAPAAVASPRGVVLDYLTRNLTDTQAFLTANGATLNATAKDDLTAQIARMQTAIASIDTASAADLLAMATYIQSNGFTAGGALSSLAIRTAGDRTICRGFKDSFVFSVITTIATAKLTSMGLPFVGTPVGLGIVAAGIGLTYLVFDRGVLRSLDGIMVNCFNFDAFTLSNYSPSSQSSQGGQSLKYVSALATAGRVSFSNDQPVTFKFNGHRSLFEEFAGSIQSSAQRLYALAVSKNYVPQSLANLVQKAGGYDEAVPASAVSLSNVTNNVTGTLSAAGTDVIALRFKTSNATSENIDFSFRLTPTEGQPLTVDATLSLSLPKVNDAAVSTTQGQGIASTLQVSGADSLEVVDGPANGTVTLQANGSYTYTPTGQFFGSDRFTYRGRNANGVSTTATVLVTVTRKLDGVWRVTSRTTTTSQSSPGLCPNESNTFTININKISDTQYSTSYQGFPITLTMTSATDPAGLSGTATATYPDEPGTSTDTINVQIPNSTTLTGNGTFSYSGPSNSRCSGTISISGVR